MAVNGLEAIGTAEAYILADTTERKDNASQAAAFMIQRGYAKIADVVLSMKDYVTSDDLIQQAKAIEYLAAVLGELANFSQTLLSRQDVSLLIKYLTVRIGTPRVVGMNETAVGLRALAYMSNFDTSDAIKVCQNIFMNADHFGEYPATSRFEVYKLVDVFLDIHRASLKKMEGEFIKGILSIAELEKDPRCLMLFFSAVLVILSEWELQGYVLDIWESVSRYFPITFRTKPDDPIGITADDLKLRLRMCIAGTSDFAPLAFPYLIEKLDYQVTANVKRDVIQTMTACIKSYGLQPVAIWASQLWDALKFEVLNATTDDLADEALTTLQAIATQLSYNKLTLQTLERTPLFRFVDVVAKESVKHLHEPQQKYAKQSGQIIGKVASGSPFAFHLIIKGVFPELITVVQDTDALTKKKELLEVFNMVLDARLEIIKAEEFSDFPSFGILDPISESCAVGTIAYGGLTFFRDVLFEMFALTLTTTTPQETSIRMTAANGLLKLVMLPGFLAPVELGMVVQHFNALVLHKDNTGNDLQDEAVCALREVAKLHPQSIVEITFPSFLGAMPDVLKDDKDLVKYLPILEALARIGSDDHLFAVLVRRLKSKLDDVVRNSVSQVYAHAILACLLYAIQQRETGSPISTLNLDTSEDHARSRYVQQKKEYSDLVRYLYHYVTVLSTYTQGPYQGKPYINERALATSHGLMYPDDIFLDFVGKIGMTAVRAMDAEDQDWAASQVFTLFADFPSKDSEASVRQTQSDIVNTSPAPKRILTLSTYLLAGLHREVELGFDPNRFCCELISSFNALEKPLSGPQDSFLGLTALLVNKWNSDASTSPRSPIDISPQSLLSDLLKSVDSMSADHGMDVIRMAISFTMAANLKGDRATKDLLYTLVDFLSNKKYGSQLAKEFMYVMAPSQLLCRENFVLMRGIYKQRPFAICVPRIVSLFKTCLDKDVKSNYLVALSGILMFTPTDFVLPEIESLIPTLLQSMDAASSSVKAASIGVLKTAIVETPSSVEGHIHSIIRRLLNRIHNTPEDPSDTPWAIRVMALKCLGKIPSNLNTTLAMSYKSEVTRALELALSDVKRDVRDEAVRCRLAWFKLAEKAKTAEESD